MYTAGNGEKSNQTNKIALSYIFPIWFLKERS